MKKTLQSIIDYLSSVRFTIVILISIAVVASVGTFVGQNAPPQEYVMRFGHNAYRILSALFVTDIYHSPYFNALLMLLVTNIVLCTLDLLPKRIRDITRRPKGTPDFHTSFQLTTRKTGTDATAAARKTLARPFCRTTVEQNGDTTVISSVPHPILGLGSIIVHIGILSVLIGGLFTSLFGFSGDMNILEGTDAHTVRVQDKYLVPLKFAIRLDKFTYKRYPDGTPREFISDITFIDGDNKTPATLTVNHPAQYKGIRFYQTNFGMDADYVVIDVLNKTGASVFTSEARWGRTVSVPGRNLSFSVVELAPELMDLGPAAHLLVTEGSASYELWTFVNYPDFDKERKGDWIFVLKDYHQVPFSGITAVKEPGLPLVFVGFIFVSIGFFFPLARSTGSYRARIVQKDNVVSVTLSGAPGRLKGGFEERFARLVDTVKEKL